MSEGESMSPLPRIGILIFLVSMICFTIYHLAGTSLFCFCVLGWIEMKCIPEYEISSSIKPSVYCHVSKVLILHETLILCPNLSTRAFMMFFAVSTLCMRAAPMPPWVLNFIGQPIFTSTPAMSSFRISTAATAV